MLGSDRVQGYAAKERKTIGKILFYFLFHESDSKTEQEEEEEEDSNNSIMRTHIVTDSPKAIEDIRR